MSNTLYIADYNPAQFLQLVEEAIHTGYYADNSVEGFPYLEAPNAITLKQIDQPDQRHDLSTFNTVVIQSHDALSFILDVQDALLQGFYLDVHSVQIGEPFTPYTVTLQKAVQATLAVTPVASPTPKEEDAPQSTTEAPTATQAKQPRKNKSKEV